MPPDEKPSPAAAPEAPLISERVQNKAPAEKESVAEGMRRLGGETVFTDDGKAEPEKTAEEPAAEAAEATEEAPKPKKKEVTPEPPAAAEIEQLRQAATKLGLVVEDGKVTTAERVKLREERRANLAAIKAAEADALKKIEGLQKDIEPKIQRADALDAAVKAGDYDGIGKALGFKDWNELQEDQLKRLQDPNHVRIRELEARLEREAAEKRKADEENERQNATRAEIQAQAQYRQKLGATMAESTDPLVKAMAKMPNFVGAVFNIQKQTYQSRGEAVAPEHAIRYVPEGGISLHDELKALYDALHPVFFKAPEPEKVAPAGTVKKPQPKSAAVPSPAPERKRALDDREWREDARRRIDEAQAEERRLARNGMRA